MLEGEINEIQLVERLVELWREQFTGAIRFESDGIIKIVYFKGGDILSASTNDRADSVDEILMRAGKVSREHVKQALAKRKENETLGDALLNLGFITRKELTWARRVQVVGVIRSIAAWTSGSFTIVADYLPKRDEGTLFPLPQVLVELIVTDQDRQKFERSMDGGTAVFAKSAEFDDVFRKLGLNEQAEGIVRQIDGLRSVAEVATASGGETFNVYKLVQALATLRILTRTNQAAAEPEFVLDDMAAAGVADAADVWNEEPQPASTPTFELDEAEALAQPTLEIQIPPETPQVTVASAWDEEEQAEKPEAAGSMPAWDLPSHTPAPPPIPVVVALPAKAEEEQWGFDEAQIETARASMVAPSRSAPPPKPGGRYGLVIALLVIAILAGAGYAAFWWWQAREEGGERGPVTGARAAAPAPAATQPVAVPDSAPVPTTTTSAVVNETVPTVIVSTQAPLPPAPAPAPVETAALPKVTPKPKPMVISAAEPSASGRERYDALARQFAANPAGNFTVQIQILCDPSNLGKVMSAGGERVWFVPQPIGARSCYRVFWGRYNTRAEAQRALAGIPADLRDPSAAVKAVPR